MSAFLKKAAEDFWILWPELDALVTLKVLPVECAALPHDKWDADQRKIYEEGLETRRKGVRTTRAPVALTSLIAPPKRRRLHKAEEKYQTMYYAEKLRALVVAEYEKRGIQNTSDETEDKGGDDDDGEAGGNAGSQKSLRSLQMAAQREVVAKAWKAESQEVKEAVYAELEVEKAEFLKNMDMSKEGLDRDPEQRQFIIGNLVSMLENVCDEVRRLTGWSTMIITGGPNPAMENVISTQTVSVGWTAHSDIGFPDLYPDFKRNIRDPYRAFLAQVYPTCPRPVDLPSDQAIDISLSNTTPMEDDVVGMTSGTNESGSELVPGLVPDQQGTATESSMSLNNFEPITASINNTQLGSIDDFQQDTAMDSIQQEGSIDKVTGWTSTSSTMNWFVPLGEEPGVARDQHLTPFPDREATSQGGFVFPPNMFSSAQPTQTLEQIAGVASLSSTHPSLFQSDDQPMQLISSPNDATTATAIPLSTESLGNPPPPLIPFLSAATTATAIPLSTESLGNPPPPLIPLLSAGNTTTSPTTLINPFPITIASTTTSIDPAPIAWPIEPLSDSSAIPFPSTRPPVNPLPVETLKEDSGHTRGRGRGRGRGRVHGARGNQSTITRDKSFDNVPEQSPIDVDGRTPNGDVAPVPLTLRTQGNEDVENPIPTIPQSPANSNVDNLIVTVPRQRRQARYPDGSVMSASITDLAKGSGVDSNSKRKADKADGQRGKRGRG
ncbi:hypothetical protein H0H93_012108 [Arthromyces matolae]|nr:hypothetical protein H0H93_012108 [Arthromyces matolae]